MNRGLLGIGLWITQYLVTRWPSAGAGKRNNTAKNRRSEKYVICNPLFSKEKRERCKKNDVSLKKGLRVPATNRRTPLTGGAETHRRGARRAGRSGNATDRDETQEEKSEVNEAGRAKEVRAHPVDFVSTLFEIDEYLKRYVGGLVHSMDQRLYIALLGSGRS